MNSEIKYPAILKSTLRNQIVMVANKNKFIHIDGEFKGEERRNYNADDTIDITHEYLVNTYGEVVSPEHAEFIIELCKVGGIDFVSSKKGISKFKYFKINESYLGFYTEPRNAKSQGIKKIIIPLPPKSEAKTWPQVDDPVTVFGQQGVLVLPADKNGMYVVESNGRYFIPKLSDITKPKSKQDLLIEELQAKLVNNNAVDNYILACDIINGDIDGLIYNPEGSK